MALHQYYRNVGNRLQSFGWGRLLVSHIRRHGALYENFEVVFTTLFLVLVIKRYAVANYVIPSGSMMDTLQVGDRILANRFIYRFTDIQVGEVVVFRVPEDIENYDPAKPYYVKRVVGVPGDTIEIGQDGYIYRNGRAVVDPPFFRENPYVGRLAAGKQFKKTRVPEGHILVFGDNSANSYDSRYWGSVPIENVMGKAFYRYWPMRPWRFGRIEGISPRPRSSPSQEVPSG